MIFSVEFFESKLPIVFKEKSINIIHSIDFSIVRFILILRRLLLINIINRKIRFVKIEINSNEYISFLVFKRPPQTILKSIIEVRISRWKTKLKQNNNNKL
jgi:hypothetical protein